MTSSPKIHQKEKPHAPPPRLQPRQTAASAARAARNATNRNLSLQPSQRQSPTRVRPVANPKVPNQELRKSPAALRYAQKADSKTYVKEPATQEPDTCVVDVPSAVLILDTSEEYAAPQEKERNDTESSESKPNEEDLHEFESENESPVSASRIRSLPQTPASYSRPQTPRSLHSSRPQTPRLASRPTTPAHPHQPSSSRPNTPQHSTPSVRPKTPVESPQNAIRIKSPEGDIKTMFTAKQREFHNMKKELDMKQQEILEVFDSLRTLSERITQEGGSGGGEGMHLQELVVFNVGDWTAEEVAQLCRDATDSTATTGAMELINTAESIDESALAEIDTKVCKVPSCFADLCLQAFTERQEIIDWVKELIGQMDDGRGESLERIARYNAQGLELCEALREVKARADNAVETVTQLSRRACQERCALVAVGEALVREIARLRQDLEARAVIVKEMREIRAENETAKALEIMNLRMALLEVEHRNEELSEVLAQKEQQLEQQEKTLRAQARVIKVREELINMLKNKQTEQSRELADLQQDLEHRMKIVEKVNKQIAAKAEEIQELFANLENKQQQIHRLEKIVLALEEQQRRAQAQRTRHEEKIAALEHELASGNRRERKFTFF